MKHRRQRDKTKQFRPEGETTNDNYQMSFFIFVCSDLNEQTANHITA